ncbi:MAG: hypothetical protein H6816_14170 [Phycisphaerales bacterium]|nr:hypothetical protein [Phycisphaerales bacterium]
MNVALLLAGYGSIFFQLPRGRPPAQGINLVCIGEHELDFRLRRFECPRYRPDVPGQRERVQFLMMRLIARRDGAADLTLSRLKHRLLAQPCSKFGGFPPSWARQASMMRRRARSADR